jgi:hypothetical protein
LAGALLPGRRRNRWVCGIGIGQEVCLCPWQLCTAVQSRAASVLGAACAAHVEACLLSLSHP